MVHKWISLNTVLSDLAMTMPSQHWNESNAKEWAFQAVRKIGCVEQYDKDIDVVTITDYKGELPSDYYRLQLLAYKLDTDELTSTELAEIEQDLNHDNDLYYTGFNGTSTFFSAYRPLRLAKSPFAISVHCTDCTNLYAVSEHTYTVHPNGTITTSFQNGTVCVAYLKYAKDCDTYLIPDDQDYIDALRSYIMMRIWEYRMNTKEEGSSELFMYYSNKWQVMRRSLVGKLKLPSIDELENIRQQRNRLVTKERDYYRGFSHRSEENIDF